MPKRCWVFVEPIVLKAKHGIAGSIQGFHGAIVPSMLLQLYDCLAGTKLDMLVRQCLPSFIETMSHFIKLLINILPARNEKTTFICHLCQAKPINWQTCPLQLLRHRSLNMCRASSDLDLI